MVFNFQQSDQYQKRLPSKRQSYHSTIKLAKLAILFDFDIKIKKVFCKHI